MKRGRVREKMNIFIEKESVDGDMSWIWGRKGQNYARVRESWVGANVYGKVSQTLMNKECSVLCTKERKTKVKKNIIKLPFQINSVKKLSLSFSIKSNF